LLTTPGLLGELANARVLDVGCGAARNTRWFAEQGATVDGIDLAAYLLDTLRPTMPTTVTLTALDVLRDPLPADAYDVVYDSGCFHHIAPHRRITYLQRVLPRHPPTSTSSRPGTRTAA
jgi:2-polyprenyl-3-methyl-5-hydroxy-6-metoxy-1,4-benzoquinol methylase